MSRHTDRLTEATPSFQWDFDLPPKHTMWGVVFVAIATGLLVLAAVVIVVLAVTK